MGEGVKGGGQQVPRCRFATESQRASLPAAAIVRLGGAGANGRADTYPSDSTRSLILLIMTLHRQRLYGQISSIPGSASSINGDKRSAPLIVIRVPPLDGSISMR